MGVQVQSLQELLRAALQKLPRVQGTNVDLRLGNERAAHGPFASDPDPGEQAKYAELGYVPRERPEKRECCVT